MAGALNSLREGRLAALLVMAETVISRTDDEKGNRDWKGRSEVLEVIASVFCQSFNAGSAAL